MNKVHVLKKSGEKEPFSAEKVEKGALRAGASEKVAREIAQKIEKEVYDGVSTEEIGRKVRGFLHKKAPGAGLRFDIKKAMRKLGPTGFPFEKFAGEVFSRSGFSVSCNQRIQGRCCSYEIDFLAEGKKEVLVGECKYRNKRGDKIDVNLVLQNYARFLDIKEGRLKRREKTRTILVTNVRFTSKAVRYSECVGTNLLGWNHPKDGGLESMIDQKGLYPVTILPSFKRKLVPYFLKNRMMLAQDVLGLNLEKAERETGMEVSVLKKLKQEAEMLLE